MQNDVDYFGPRHKFVIELSPDDFDDKTPWILKTHNQTGMVMFYAPWCGYCKALKPEWEKAAKVAGFCNFMAFNCEKYKDFVSKLSVDYPTLVKGFPSIIVYDDGNPIRRYAGERTSSALVEECMRVCVDGKCR